MRGQGWGDYERAGEQGPLTFAFKCVIGLAVIVAAIWGIGTVFGWFNEAATVAQEEFGARALLKKYEWFKDASAGLDKKQADVQVYDSRLKILTLAYSGKTRAEWARDDREQSSVWSSELAGIKASYNQLAAEYNSEMAKFNWRFANAGSLPQGADRPVQREYKLYLTE